MKLKYRLTLRKIGWVSMLCIFLLSQASSVVFALSDNQKKDVDSNIHFFNTDDSCSAAPTATTDTATTATGKVYQIGDSLTVGMRDSGNLQPKLTAAGNSVTQIEGTVGIGIGASEAKIQADKTNVQAADKIVVELGTNDLGASQSSDEAAIKSMIREIKKANSTAQIYWMNTYSTIKNMSKINAAINSQASALGYKLINWSNEVTSHPGKYTFDASLGVHPSGDGYPKLSDFVVQSLGSSPTTTSVGAATGSTTVNISSIVSKYGLQSAVIQELGGGTIADSHADEPPSTPASTMKLIIADVLLRSELDLSSSVAVGRDVYYSGGNDLGTRNTTLQNALQQMLSRSSNVGANVIMKALGGVNAFTTKAQSYGYTHTTVKGYYDPANDGKNDSTISDQATAMNHIFSTRGAGYTIAQNALQAAAQSDNHYGVTDDANKWAGTSTVAGNVGKFKVGGKDYIIGLYINKSSSDPDAIKAIKNGSADLAAAIGSSPSASGTPTAGQSCCSESDTDVSDAALVGNSNAEKVWNFFIDPAKGLSKVQVAGIMGNLQVESGFDPTIVYGGSHNPDPSDVSVAWGLGQWLPGSKVLGIQRDAHVSGNIAKLSTQLNIMWWEINNRSPTATQHMIDGLKLITDYTEAVQYWQRFYEGSSGQGDSARINAAHDWINHTGSAGTTPAPSADTTGTSSGCGSSDTSNQSIAQEALKLAWPDSSHGVTPTDAYQQAYDQFNPHGAGVADCGSFVATVMHASGADPDYPASSTSAQETYVRGHPEKYDVIDKVNEITDLHPGDILIVNKGSGADGLGHTYIFVGNQPPHNYDEASASQNSRAASLGKAVLNDTRGDYIRVRLK